RSCEVEGLDERCMLVGGVPQWAGCITPLVLSFDASPVIMEPSPAASFDIMDAGGCVSTDWPTAATPWLALDRDGDGLVETGAELFGSGTRMPDGRHAGDGFEALSELDTDGDGKITRADERFDELVLWSDVDRDKRGTALELEPLSARGILSIELDYRSTPRCDARGNCEIERARFRFIDGVGSVGRGEVVDVHLACQ
ncbi:MAG: calcium-binding protein, partial [Myxococcales bacterium]|nr:calcium-binding protein [Myxococcales bacterium]